MNRFMVSLGLGSLILFSSTQFNPCARAEYPTSLRGSTTEMSRPVNWHTDLQSGWREAKSRNVPMVIFITTDSCIYCDAMKRDTWCNDSVANRLSKGFVAIHLNKHKNQQTLGRIEVTTYPTTILGTPNGKVIGHRLGYQPPTELHAFLGEAKTSVSANSSGKVLH